MEFAIVKNQQAIVYADKFLTSPIGYIKKGKKIKVGEQPDNRGLAYPIIVSQKIAYIKGEDITLLDGSVLELPVGHESIRGLDLKKRAIVVNAQYFGSNWQASQYNTANTSSVTTALSGVQVLYHYKETNRYFFRGGLELLSGSQGSESLSIPSAYASTVYRIWNADVWKVNALFGLGFSPFATYTAEPFFRLDGFALSAEAGLEYNYFFSERVYLNLQGKYRSTKLAEFSTPKGYPGFAPLLTGMNLGLGLSFTY